MDQAEMGAYIRRRKTQRKQVGELHKMRRLAAMATVGKMAAGGCAGILTKTLAAPLEGIKAPQPWALASSSPHAAPSLISRGMRQGVT